MMKSVVSLVLASLVLSLFAASPSHAQKKKEDKVPPAPAPATVPPQLTVPGGPTFVAVDAPPPKPPPLISNINELRFGSQATGVESCLQVTITNISQAAQTITKLFTGDEKHYTIPSPSQKMLPVNIQPHSNLVLSLCFKPEKPGQFKTRLVITTPQDSLVLPVDGKGIKPEDVGKLPKMEFSVSKTKKKNHEWTLRYVLVAQSKITLQLLDDLGATKVIFLNGAFKNEGVYEMQFDETDKGKQKLPPGKYYVRCQIEEVARANQPVRFTKELEIK
jgi:hypothetical protein